MRRRTRRRLPKGRAKNGGEDEKQEDGGEEEKQEEGGAREE